MIQDIAPHKLDNSFKPVSPRGDDYVLIFENNTVFLSHADNGLQIPTYSFIKDKFNIPENKFTYLFKIDNINFFMLSAEEMNDIDTFFSKEDMNIFRTLQPSWTAFGGITGKHLYDWYSSHKFCGKCGHPTKNHDVERALFCESCGSIVYPSIAPAIIVAITNKDKILLTKYSRGYYKRYALVAGYTEIGETLEETVQREVMEEVGLKVKNIKYYKSQPWGFSNSLLMGFFAELDGSDEVCLEEDELSVAEWLRYDEIPENDLHISLTWEMIRKFISMHSDK